MKIIISTPFSFCGTLTLDDRIRRTRRNAEIYCSICLVAGHRCHDYTDRWTIITPDELARLPTRRSIVAHHLSFDFPGSQKERRFMSYFHEQSVPDLAGIFNSNFWNRIVLQVGRREPAIHHALVALSAAHENFKLKQDPEEADARASNQSFAIQQYNKAIKHLSEHLSSGTGRVGAEVALICCVVFICLESLQGNLELALAHLESGLSILRNWRKEIDSPLSRGSEIIGKEILINLFLRLEIQASGFLKTRKPQLEMLTAGLDSRVRPPISATFRNIDEAKDSQEKLTVWLFRYLALNAKYKSVASSERPPSVTLEHIELKTQFQLFSVGLEGLLKKPLSTLDHRAAIVLKIRYEVTLIMLATTSPALPMPKTQPHDLRWHYRSLISLSESLLRNPKSKKIPSAPVFSFDANIVAPLYFTAMNCPDPAMCQEALYLLKVSPRREGVFDAATVAQVAEKKIGLAKDEACFVVPLKREKSPMEP